ncbi:phosphohydrolase [Geobacillus thermocatenulatus]|uniref:Phosphohydrolase n=1 Tax=Geobacillus thermocatenulatus TaxID=33938 RepID=A0A226Q545_9BACL|nr:MULTISPECIES: HD-GYP domain-containing protein [Geobacillus]AST00230.1 phosphohydrolase [Geobacillus thermocatenulatus]KLR72245.1 phosphohydrolase [Geobacillus sp. T6]OXB86582.1 phosphohydrolase [Geobacillus thermocatenulatus]RAN30056.1 phosphohydrolase [Geobacillus sp. A8]
MYRSFVHQLLRHYVTGSAIAVMGVGSTLMLTTLAISWEEAKWLIGILLFSAMVMGAAEWIVFRRDLAPIRRFFSVKQPDEELAAKALEQARRLPLLAVRRILGPHLFGLSIPGMGLTALCIHYRVLSLPYRYILYAFIGAILIASLHALIEFFLTTKACRPLMAHLLTKAGGIDEKRPPLPVPLKMKLQLTVLFSSTFPVLLFSLATEIKWSLAGPSASHWSYWPWAAVILLFSTAFSVFLTRLLVDEINEPVSVLLSHMKRAENEMYELIAHNVYTDEFAYLLRGFNHMIDAVHRRDRTNKELLNSFITVLTAALDARDPYTAGHSQRVARYALTIGKQLSLPNEQLDALYRSALLHDIGKIGVPDAILLKDGKLSDDEFAWIKKHPALGEAILREVRPIEPIEPLLAGIRSHHERIDGKGYPDGLTGNDIPLFGKIIAVADAFDAMTSDRPYRKGMDIRQAADILRKGKGTQWDSELVDLFLKHLQEEKLLSTSAAS